MSPQLSDLFETPSVEAVADQVLAAHWHAGMPVDPFALARAMGAQVIAHNGPESGCLTISEDGTVFISVNTNEPIARQRFTVAHEIGHWKLNHGNSFRDDSSSFTTSANRYVERQANEFAACLLMPRAYVKHLAISKGLNVSSLATIFSVSTIAMEFRLKNLGLIS